MQRAVTKGIQSHNDIDEIISSALVSDDDDNDDDEGGDDAFNEFTV